MFNFRLTIRKKLNLALTGLQVLTVVSITGIAGYLFTEDLPGVLRKSNLDLATLLASRVHMETQWVAGRMRAIAIASTEEFKSEDAKLKFMQEMIAADNQIFAVSLYEAHESTSGNPNASLLWRVVNPQGRMKKADLDELDRKSEIRWSAAFRGKTEVSLMEFTYGQWTLRLAAPLTEKTTGKVRQILVGEINPDRLNRLIGEVSSFPTFVLDSQFNVLLSSHPTRFQLNARADENLIKSFKGQPSSLQIDFSDTSKSRHIASTHAVGIADLNVVVQTPYDQIVAVRDRMIKRAGILGIAVFCLSVWLAILLSTGLKQSIYWLSEAAARVTKGDFKVRLPVNENPGAFGRDEIEEFSLTFNKMVEGLDERDRMRSAFDKLHGEKLTSQVMNKPLALGGKTKNCIVLFSDIRNFTVFSERMNPDYLVQVLSRYLDVMISVIERHQGHIINIAGDGIMAVWGIEDVQRADIDRAMNACFDMRKALETLNAELKSEGRFPLFMGMGLHYGAAVVGTIGSARRMTFTVIGDTANTASRIESATKEFGTDFLVSEAVLELTRTRYLIEQVDSKLKGKNNPVTLFKVHGLVDHNGIKQFITTPFSQYEPEKMSRAVFDESFINFPFDPDEKTQVTQIHQIVFPDEVTENTMFNTKVKITA